MAYYQEYSYGIPKLSGVLIIIAGVCLGVGLFFMRLPNDFLKVAGVGLAILVIALGVWVLLKSFLPPARKVIITDKNISFPKTLLSAYNICIDYDDIVALKILHSLEFKDKLFIKSSTQKGMLFGAWFKNPDDLKTIKTHIERYKKLLTMDKTPYYQKYKYRISKKFGLIFLLSSVVLLLFFISQLFYNSEPLRVFYVFYLSSGVLEFIWKTLIIICLIMICYGFVMLIKAFGKPNFVIVTDTYIQFPYPPLLPIKTIKFLYKDIQKIKLSDIGKRTHIDNQRHASKRFFDDWLF